MNHAQNSSVMSTKKVGTSALKPVLILKTNKIVSSISMLYLVTYNMANLKSLELRPGVKGLLTCWLHANYKASQMLVQLSLETNIFFLRG